MVSFIAREAEDTFFQNGISAVPESDGETDILMTVGDAGQPVFVPAISTGAGLVVRKRFPCGSVRTIVFPDGSPSPFAEIGPPAFPMFLPAGVFIETLLLLGERCRIRGG